MRWRSIGAWAGLAGTLAGGLLGEVFDARTVLWCAVAAGAGAAGVAALTLGRRPHAAAAPFDWVWSSGDGGDSRQQLPARLGPVYGLRFDERLRQPGSPST